MDVRVRCEADALMVDLTNHHHQLVTGASQDEIERRMWRRYPNAIAVLVREKTRTEAGEEVKR